MTISDRIRKQLDQPDGVTADALEPLATEFGRETVQVNARLSECVHLLRKGLRSEAIQRAFMKPNILDWSARLDFPELDEWLDILKFYGITVPTLLDRDAAQQLQEAIVDEQPLEELLRQHRRLAIAKAPLQWRLKVLRTLVKKDALNSVWREDQEQWETIRLKQIPKELKRAIDAKEISVVRDIATELSNSKWAIKPPADLCKLAASSVSSFQYEEQVLQLQTIADRLHAAYSEGNESAASRQSQSWNEIFRALTKPLPEDLAQSVEPAMEWLKGCVEERERVERHENATAALMSRLQRKSPLADLQRAYYDLTSMQMGVDPILEQRYETHVAEIRQTARRRMQMTFFAVAASAVSLLLLFGLWQWNRTYRLAVSDSVSRLTALIESKNLSEADSLVQKLTSQAPSIVQSPEVGALVAKLKSEQEAESTRSTRVAGLIEEALVGPNAASIQPLVTAVKGFIGLKDFVQASGVLDELDSLLKLGSSASDGENRVVAFTQARLKWDTALKTVASELGRLEQSILTTIGSLPAFPKERLGELEKGAKKLFTIFEKLDGIDR